jgi:hypothetical protein
MYLKANVSKPAHSRSSVQLERRWEIALLRESLKMLS